MTTYMIFFVRRYVTCPRIVGIFLPTSISLPTSLFTRSVMHHPATNALVTLLARLIVMCITERAQRYLSDNRSDKSSSRYMPTQQTPLETPVEHIYNHLVTLWRLVAHKVFLQRYSMGWRISRLGFGTPIVGEVSLGPLGNAHHYKSCKHCD